MDTKPRHPAERVALAAALSLGLWASQLGCRAGRPDHTVALKTQSQEQRDSLLIAHSFRLHEHHSLLNDLHSQTHASEVIEQWEQVGDSLPRRRLWRRTRHSHQRTERQQRDSLHHGSTSAAQLGQSRLQQTDARQQLATAETPRQRPRWFDELLRWLPLALVLGALLWRRRA